MTKMTPEQEAGYVLSHGLDPEGLTPEVRAEYDRLAAALSRQDPSGLSPEARVEYDRLKAAAPLTGNVPPRESRLAPVVHDGLAIASLVLSLVWLWGLGSLLAVIFGAISRTEARKAGRQPSALATAGLILGIIGLVAAVIITIAIIVMANSHSSPCDPSNPNWPNC